MRSIRLVPEIGLVLLRVETKDQDGDCEGCYLEFFNSYGVPTHIPCWCSHHDSRAEVDAMWIKLYPKENKCTI